LVASIGVSALGRTVAASGGSYAVAGMKVGDILTLTITPRDRDAYKISTATIEIVNPRLELKPESAKFNRPKGGIYGEDAEYTDEGLSHKGQITVKLEKPVGLGERYILCVDLYLNGTRIKHDKEQQWVEHQPAEDGGGLIKVIDLGPVIMQTGPGYYEVEAYIKGNDDSSDSEHAADNATFIDRDFGPRLVILSHPDILKPGDTVTVLDVRDNFGNKLTDCVYEWWKYPTDSSGTAGPIITDGNAENKYFYTVARSDFGWVPAVRIAKRMPGFGAGWGPDSADPDSVNNNGKQEKCADPVCFPVTYDANGGQFVVGLEKYDEWVEPIYVNRSDAPIPAPAIGNPTEPPYPNWVFDCWYRSTPGDFLPTVDTSDTDIQGLTLYANWVPPGP
jgi:hypothetical protein